MADQAVGQADHGIFYCRIGTGLILEIIAELCLLTAIGKIYYEYGLLITDDQAACYLKAGFSLFLIAAIIQGILLIFDGAIVLAIVFAAAPCTCNFSYIKISSHFCSLLSILLGSMIYGIKEKDKLGWGFWIALGSGVFVCLNWLVWMLTQQIRTFLKKAGVDVATLGRGGMIG